METIENAKSLGQKNVFEVVESVPRGYQIWNIGKNMIDGYLPLCKLSASQPFEGAQCVDVNTLKAIKTESAQIILAACGRGPCTVAQMEQYIEKHAKLNPEACEKMLAALPYMREIKGL